MKSFPFAVAVIAQTSYAVKTSSSPPTAVEEFVNYSEHKYHWYDAPYMACVAYSADYSYIEYFDANECCLEANLGCDRADPNAKKTWRDLFLHYDETGMVCRHNTYSRWLTEDHYSRTWDKDEDEYVKMTHGGFGEATLKECCEFGIQAACAAIG